jgi:hypothetical protein
MKNTATTKPQKAVIKAINENGPLTDAGLAEVLGGSPSSKNKTAEALIRKGLLARVEGHYTTIKQDAEAPVDEAPEADQAEAPADEHNHEEVAATMAAEVESAKGTTIRVAAPIVAVLTTKDATDEVKALVKRIKKADTLKDDSVRIPMTKDEREVLLGIAEDLVENGEGSAKSAARALVKWLNRPEVASAA